MWYERYKPAENKGPWYLPDPEKIGKTLEQEDIAHLKRLILTKKKELETQTHNM